VHLHHKRLVLDIGHLNIQPFGRAFITATLRLVLPPTSLPYPFVTFYDPGGYLSQAVADTSNKLVNPVMTDTL
jgi:hypothetical protein